MMKIDFFIEEVEARAVGDNSLDLACHEIAAVLPRAMSSSSYRHFSTTILDNFSYSNVFAFEHRFEGRKMSGSKIGKLRTRRY